MASSSTVPYSIHDYELNEFEASLKKKEILKGSERAELYYYYYNTSLLPILYSYNTIDMIYFTIDDY